MLFLALGKAKGVPEIQTVKPILTITPPPEPCNLNPFDYHETTFDVFSGCGRKGDKKLIHQKIINLSTFKF